MRTKAFNDSRHDTGGQRVNVANAELLPLRARFDPANRYVHAGQNVLRFLIKSFPCRCQGNVILASNDEDDADFVFKAFDLSAQCRLRQVQLVCRPAKTSVCGHGRKIP
ncbi:MAG TPA: hypothetical protein VFE51_15730 [Verrucomicrobiae bacterium]|nr:hypothetical protein [Verrucomicrobiae bacterium]